MSLSINPTFIRKFFGRAFANAEVVDALWWGALDAQNADFATVLNQCKSRLEAISTAAGSLRYSLTQTQRFVATSGQTAFTMPQTYDHVNDLVAAWSNGVRIDDSLVVKTSDTVVTLPAQSLNTVVIIDVRSAGNGTSQLASTTVGQGSGLVGYSNQNGLSASSTVEAALAELFSDINSSSFLSGILGMTAYLKADGSVAWTGNGNANGKKLTALGAGSASTNDAARMADITAANLYTTLAATLLANLLPLAGGTMVGNINMNGNKVSGATQGSVAGDYVTIDQIPGLTGAGKNAVVNGNGLVANGATYTASVAGTFGYGQCENWKGALGGSTVAGTLQQGTGRQVGATGRSILWASVSTTGAGTATWRVFIEAKDAARLIGGKASLQFKMFQDSGAPITVVANVYKANAVDDFTAITSLYASPPLSVPNLTATAIQFPAISMAACGNGVLVEVVATIGAVTNKNFDLTEVQLEPGSYCSPIEYETVGATLAKVQRLYAVLGCDGQANGTFGVGSAQDTTHANIYVPFPVPMRVRPILGVAATANLQVTDGTTATAVSGIGEIATSGTTRGMWVEPVVASGLTAWRPYFLQGSNSNATLEFDARF